MVKHIFLAMPRQRLEEFLAELVICWGFFSWNLYCRLFLPIRYVTMVGDHKQTTLIVKQRYETGTDKKIYAQIHTHTKKGLKID